MQISIEDYKHQDENSFNRPPRTAYRQLYRPAWEDVIEFRDWIAPVTDNPYKAYCKFCERELHTHRLSLLKHCTSLKHEIRLKQFQELFSSKKTTETAATASYKPIHSHSMKYTSCPSTSKSSGLLNVHKKMCKRLGSSKRSRPRLSSAKSNDNATEKMVSPNHQQRDIVSDDRWVDNLIGSDHEDEPLISHHDGDDIAFEDAIMSPQTSTTSKSKFFVYRSPITTHVLDTARGKPACGIKVSLYTLVDGRWTFISENVTNDDGRCSDLLTQSAVTTARFKLHFDVDSYFKASETASLYPFIEIVFDYTANNDEKDDHCHIPLLLSPFGYSTYKAT